MHLKRQTKLVSYCFILSSSWKGLTTTFNNSKRTEKIVCIKLQENNMTCNSEPTFLSRWNVYF